MNSSLNEIVGVKIIKKKKVPKEVLNKQRDCILECQDTGDEIILWTKIITQSEKFHVGKSQIPLVDINIDEEEIDENHLILCIINFYFRHQFK